MDDQSPQEEVTIDMPSQEPLSELAPDTTKTTETVEQSNPQPDVPTPPVKPDRDEKGHFLEGNQISVGNKGGAPCMYCSDKQKYQTIADDYMRGIVNSPKPATPWIEELALFMDIDDETLTIWAKKTGEDGVKEHPELSVTFSRLKSLQKLRLKQRAMGRFTPHGALYLLNADHKVIQTNKEIVSGDTQEPLKIIITEEKELQGE